MIAPREAHIVTELVAREGVPMAANYFYFAGSLGGKLPRNARISLASSCDDPPGYGLAASLSISAIKTTTNLPVDHQLARGGAEGPVI